VGKQLAAMAGQHMKRMTMELGGHAPVVIFDDADVALAAKTMAGSKFRNAGQVCVSPTRFLVQEGVYKDFVAQFVMHAEKLQVGNGMDAASSMGPLANPRRMAAMQNLIADARQQHGQVKTGGDRLGSSGNFWSPTVITEMPTAARAMSEEPFGPMALINPFTTFDDAVREANRLPFGLAAYAWTRSARTAQQIAASVETGMITINHLGLGMPETPFGGVKDSGYGSEGGSEALEAYLNPKFVSQAGLKD
jgi:succinate-semialdehyde dehydrogenase/glutarate-semialdehyde dehydrogenase